MTVTENDRGLRTTRDLSLELTLQCNQQCVHCYNESGPGKVSPEDLNPEDFLRLVREGSEAGCTTLRLIGGEPVLHPRLNDLIRAARERGYSYVEVYSNMTILPNRLLETLVETGTAVATSFYSVNPQTHDRITGSRTPTKNWYNLVQNIRRLVDAKVPVRAGVIVIDQRREEVQEAVNFLEELKVHPVHVAPVQGLGRGLALKPVTDPKDGLCGNCYNGSLAVSAQGRVYPCTMARLFEVGNVREASLADIARSERVRAMRTDLRSYFSSKSLSRMCGEGYCDPTSPPPPCSPETSRCPPRADHHTSDVVISGVPDPCVPYHGTPPSCSPKSDAYLSSSIAGSSPNKPRFII